MINPSKKESVFCSSENEKKLTVKVQKKRDDNKNLFDRKVEKDTDGCLQDVHWYAGLFGYFPTYSLGALNAAQFASQLRIDLPELDLNVEKGKFDDLVKWLKTNIHEKASFFSTNEVLEQVTKSSLNAKYFKNYINNRYL